MIYVSVIMAEYNTKKEYLQESIASILAQTYKNFELIIIDDKGINDVDAIVKAFGDQRIRVIKNFKNKGLVESLNRAVSIAKGEFLVRMDTDDIAESDRIEKLYKFISTHPEYAVVGSRVQEFSDDGKSGILGKDGEKTKRSIVKGDGLIHPSVIFRKAAVENVGGYPDYNRAEDFALWSELLIHGYRLWVMNDVLLKYRVNVADYSKRKLKYRGGEIKSKLYYYPRLGARPIDYMRILRSIMSGVAPTRLVYIYRHKFVVQRTSPPYSESNARLNSFNLISSTISTIAESNQSIKFKRRSIRSQLDKYNKNRIESSGLSPIGRVYQFVFKHRLTILLLTLEYFRRIGLKNIFPIHTVEKIIYYTSRKDYYDKLTMKTKKIIILLAADYGNLGDAAITEAQYIFLKEKFPDYVIVEVPISETYKRLRLLKRRMTDYDVLTIVGGGNSGSLYKGIEDQRRFIIEKFPNNPIIVFPQSIYYGKTKSDNRYLRKGVKIYGSHQKLTLTARDVNSYNFMKRKFVKNNIILAPDIALFLEIKNLKVPRKSDLTVLSIRNDKESDISSIQVKRLVSYLEEHNYKVITYDTDLGDVRLNVRTRREELDKIWQIFAGTGLVITDRLHGMIFCVLTGTPCIVVNNNNGKVGALYKKWLKNISNLTYIESFTLPILAKQIAYIEKIKSEPLVRNEIKDHFDNLTKIINNEIKMDPR